MASVICQPGYVVLASESLNENVNVEETTKKVEDVEEIQEEKLEDIAEKRENSIIFQEQLSEQQKDLGDAGGEQKEDKGEETNKLENSQTPQDGMKTEQPENEILQENIQQTEDLNLQETIKLPESEVLQELQTKKDVENRESLTISDTSAEDEIIKTENTDLEDEAEPNALLGAAFDFDWMSGKLTINIEHVKYWRTVHEDKIDKIITVEINATGTTDASNLFEGCKKLEVVELSCFDTKNITDMSNMFLGCESLRSLDLSGFNVQSLQTADSMLEGCNMLASINTPCNLTTSVALPVVEGAVWRLPDGTAITELPQNLSDSVLITRSKNPQIITTTEELNYVTEYYTVGWVKYVPYSCFIKTDNTEENNKVTYSIENGNLATGLQLFPETGEIYGVPMETGQFPITIKATFSNPEYSPSYADLVLMVLDNTDSNVFLSSDQHNGAGYNVETYIGKPLSSGSRYTVFEYADQLFVSGGAYREFIDLWLNGEKLIDGEDYTKEEGSTRITIRAQTFVNKARNGANTLAAEFRVDGDLTKALRRTAQNFYIQKDEDTGSSGNSGSSGQISDYSADGNLASFAIRLINPEGNPFANLTIELHSTPKTSITNRKGFAVFRDVEGGGHTFYVKDKNGNILASRNFELVFGDQTVLDENRVIVKAGSVFTLQVQMNGSDLTFLSVQEGDTYRIVAPQTGDEKNPSLWLVMLILCGSMTGGVCLHRRKWKVN